MNDQQAHPEPDPVEPQERSAPFLQAISRRINLVRRDYPDMNQITLDALFLAYLLECSRFGQFSYGPIAIDVSVVEDRFARTYPRVKSGGESDPGYSASAKRFYERLSKEMARSGKRRIDELHWLLAFMRSGEGLPDQVFSELGISPEQVEAFARGPASQPQGAGQQKLYSPEEVAEYLGVHVQTVRAWIRSGKLPASRLAGQRALRVRQSDIAAVLEPVDPTEFD